MAKTKRVPVVVENEEEGRKRIFLQGSTHYQIVGFDRETGKEEILEVAHSAISARDLLSLISKYKGDTHNQFSVNKVSRMSLASENSE